MKRHGNLWHQVTDANNIELAYRKARLGKSNLRGVLNFETAEEANLEAIRHALVNRTFHTARYTRHTVYEPKRRTIYALPFSPDRIVQHALMNVLEPIWTSLFIHDTYACLKGRGPHAGSTRCMQFTRQSRYVLQSDVAQFYPSLDHEVCKRIVRRKIKCADTLWLLDDIIDSFPGPVNVPIGNLTSQWMGNLYLNELDQFAKHQLKARRYIRYCDDFLVFSDDKGWLAECRERIRGFCAEQLKLTLKKSELFPTRTGVDFLGYRHFPDGYVLLRKRTAKRIRRKVLSPAFAAREVAYRRSALASISGWVSHANCHHFAQSIRLEEQLAQVAADEAAASGPELVLAGGHLVLAARDQP